MSRISDPFTDLSRALQLAQSSGLPVGGAAPTPTSSPAPGGAGGMGADPYSMLVRAAEMKYDAAPGEFDTAQGGDLGVRGIYNPMGFLRSASPVAAQLGPPADLGEQLLTKPIYDRPMVDLSGMAPAIPAPPPEGYKDPRGPVGFMESIGDSGLEQLPFVGSGSKIIKDARTALAAWRIKEGFPEPGDEVVVAQHLAREYEDQSRGRTVGGVAGDIVKNLPGFAVEFGTGSGLYAGTKRAAREAVGGLTGGAARRLAVKTAGATAGAAAQTPATMAARITSNLVERRTPGISSDVNDRGAVELLLSNPKDGFGESLAKAVADGYIEVLSERGGHLLGMVPGADKLSAIKGAVVRRWLSSGKGRTVGQLLDKVAKESGWHGVLGEMFEERLGDAMRNVAGVTDPQGNLPSPIPSMDQLAAEGIAFSLMPAGSATIRKIADFVGSSESDKNAGPAPNRASGERFDGGEPQGPPAPTRPSTPGEYAHDVVNLAAAMGLYDPETIRRELPGEIRRRFGGTYDEADAHAEAAMSGYEDQASRFVDRPPGDPLPAGFSFGDLAKLERLAQREPSEQAPTAGPRRKSNLSQGVNPELLREVAAEYGAKGDPADEVEEITADTRKYAPGAGGERLRVPEGAVKHQAPVRTAVEAADEGYKIAEGFDDAYALDDAAYVASELNKTRPSREHVIVQASADEQTWVVGERARRGKRGHQKPAAAPATPAAPKAPPAPAAPAEEIDAGTAAKVKELLDASGGEGSVSLVQRRLMMGFKRAERYVQHWRDQRGATGPDGSTPEPGETRKEGPGAKAPEADKEKPAAPTPPPAATRGEDYWTHTLKAANGKRIRARVLARLNDKLVRVELDTPSSRGPTSEQPVEVESVEGPEIPEVTRLGKHPAPTSREEDRGYELPETPEQNDAMHHALTHELAGLRVGAAELEASSKKLGVKKARQEQFIERAAAARREFDAKLSEYETHYGEPARGELERAVAALVQSAGGTAPQSPAQQPAGTSGSRTKSKAAAPAPAPEQTRGEESAPSAPEPRGQGGEDSDASGRSSPDRTAQSSKSEKLIDLAGTLAIRLRTDKDGIGSFTLFQLADQAMGGTRAGGYYTDRDAYDALELAVNLHAKKVFGTSGLSRSRDSMLQTVETIDGVSQSLPTMTRRTEEQVQLQQFSTPPAFAAAAVWAANIAPGEIVLEPSAGAGGLVVWAQLAGGKVYANEIAPRRADLLEALHPEKVYREDAGQLNNVLPKDLRPTVIVMNPPFSSAVRGGEQIKDSHIGAQHVEQALKRLAPGGRLVAIVGKGMSLGAPTFKGWWGRIAREYTVRANVGVSGDVYKKYGTTFGTRVLVIDKTGPTPDSKSILQVDVASIPVLLNELEEIRNARGHDVRGGSAPAVEAGQGGARRGEEPAGGAGVVGAGRERGGAQPQDRRGAAPEGGRDAGVGAQAGGGVPVPGGRGAVQPDAAGETQPEGGRGGAGGGAARSDGGQQSGVRGAGGSGEPGGLTAEKPAGSTRRKGALTESLYEAYTPVKVRFKGAQKHPTPLVESAAMAAVDPPEATYTPNLPPEFVTEGVLSDAQLEAVTYAGQAHENILEDGRRQAYFIGDGTGVGKGREIAAVILDNWRRGRKRAVWVTMNVKLVESARRDWKALGAPGPMTDLSKSKPADTIDLDEGVVVLTYDTLKSSAKGENGKPGRSRIEQLQEWLGKDFDGVIAFDESHNMANAIATEGGRGMKDPAAKALAGVKLQDSNKTARMLYVSATGATEISNLAYAQNLGLWGHNTAFGNAAAFIRQVGGAGLSAMELVARDLKALGRYIARGLSYDGVDYSPVVHALTEKDRKIYNDLAGAWQLVLRNLTRALEGTAATTDNAGNPKIDSRAKMAALSQFWGAHQRFFNQIITAFKIPTVIGSIERDLAEGRAVVIQLTNTNEAATDRAIGRLDEDQSIEDLDVTPREMLMDYLRRSFPTAQYHEVPNAVGEGTHMEVVKDSSGAVVENAEAVAIRDELLSKLGSISVPDSPLDKLIDHFGTSVVGENTGRKRRAEWVQEDEGRARRLVPRGLTAVMADVQAFNDDKKRILIFSLAGGTGQSYHADRTFKNQRQRAHYLLQAGWRADAAVQGLGRTHRSNQAVPPIYRLVSTDLAGEKRFIATIARRLDQLGAITKGQREAGSGGVFSADDNLENQYARDGLTRLLRDVRSGKIPGIPVAKFEQQTGIDLSSKEGQEKAAEVPLSQFLNRLLSLDVDFQNGVFEEFLRRMRIEVDRAKASGSYEAGIETVRGDSGVRKTDDTLLGTQPNGAQTRLVTVEVENKTHPQTHDTVADRLGGDMLFVRNIKSGRVYAAGGASGDLNEENGRIEVRRRLYSPLGFARSVDDDALTDPDSWERLKRGPESKKAWQVEIDSAPKTTTETMHVMTGVVLPVWDRIPGGRGRVVRLQTDEGERFIGLKIPESKVDEVKTNFGRGVERPDWYDKPEEVGFKVQRSGIEVRFSNGWRLARRRVDGELVLELMDFEAEQRRELLDAGLQSRIIDHKTRYFIPVSDTSGDEILAKLLRGRQIVGHSAAGSKAPAAVPGPTGGPSGQRPPSRGGPGARPGFAINPIAELLTAAGKAAKVLAPYAARTLRRFKDGFHVGTTGVYRITARATDAMKTMGRWGQLLAKQTEGVAQKAAKRGNTDEADLHGAIKGLSAKDREIVGMIGWGNENKEFGPLASDLRAKHPKLAKVADQLLGIFDRSMDEAAELGIARGAGMGKRPTGGGGNWYPQVPNAKGREILDAAFQNGLADQRVMEWAKAQVGAGLSDSETAALASLLEYRENRARGQNAYFESYRVRIPSDWVDFDIASTGPALLHKNALFVEAVREWGTQLEGARALIAKIGEDQSSPALSRKLHDWLQANFDAFPEEAAARSFFGAWSNFETFTRLGLSAFSALQNFMQGFTNTQRWEIGSQLKAAAALPPVVWRWTKAGRELAEQVERAGATSDVGAQAGPDARYAGFGLVQLGLTAAGFSAAEKENQLRSAVVAAFGLRADIERLIAAGWTGEESRGAKVLQALASLTMFSDPIAAVARRVQKFTGLSRAQLIDKITAGERLTEEELQGAMWMATHDNQFVMDLASEPLWWRTSPLGRLAFKFKTWGLRQIEFISENVAKEARRGNFGPLVRFTLAALVLGELFNLLRDWLMGDDRALTTKLLSGDYSARDIAKRILGDLGQAGAFGFLNDITYGLGEWLGGPAWSTLKNVGETAVKVTESARRNEWKNAVEALGEGAKRQVAAAGQVSKVVRNARERDDLDGSPSKARKAAKKWVADRKLQDPGDVAQDFLARVLGQQGRQTAGFNALPLSEAAEAIDRGDTKAAAGYLRRIIRQAPIEKMEDAIAGIKRSASFQAPIGAVPDKELGVYLRGKSLAERERLKALNRAWLRDYGTALRLAIAEAKEAREWPQRR